MSKTVKYVCDRCGDPIDKDWPTHLVGGNELCTLSYFGTMGHNQFTTDFHYHYQCFGSVVRAIAEQNKAKEPTK